MTLVLHPVSADMLERLSQRLPQALLLTGEVGVGLSSVAHWVARRHSQHEEVVLPQKDEVVDTAKGTIGVKLIRELYRNTRTKQTGARIVIIDYAERMTLQAQNAFLKLLEEPPEATHFILASHEPERLLPTILSRVQRQDLRPISPEQSVQLLDEQHVTDSTKRTQLLFMAEGLPAELLRLIHDEAYFTKRVTVMRHARDLLQGSRYDKLLIAQRYQQDRQQALLLVGDSSRILRHSLRRQPQPAMITQLNQLLDVADQIAANGNIRLQLARIVL